MKVIYILILFLEVILSLKQYDVSECVCLSLNYYEMADPNELKFWGMIPLGVQTVLGWKKSGFVEPLAGK